MAEKKDEDAGSQRIERAKVADLAETQETASGFDDIVRGLSSRFVNDESAVDGRWLGSS